MYKPFSPACLKDMLEEERRAWAWKLHMARLGEGVLRRLGYKVTPFSEIIGIKEPAVQDTRTGEEIFDDFMKKLDEIAGKEG